MGIEASASSISAESAKQGSFAPRPIFIIGAGRSGTSILTWALGQHPNIMTLPETNWIAALASYLGGIHALGSSRGTYTQLSAFGVTRARFFQAFGPAIDQLIRTSFVERYGATRAKLQAGMKPPAAMAVYRSADDAKQRWVDGTPGNTGYAGLLSDVFPEALFVHILRDPSEVVRSLLGFAHRATMFPKPEAALRYAYHQTHAGHLAEASLGSERVTRVFQRELQISPETMFQNLLTFLGEAYSEDCLRHLQDRINSSGEASAAVDAELASLNDNPMMLSMQEWFAASADPNWRIVERDEATALLWKYSSRAVLLPSDKR
jgi:hypothetical protein